MERFTGTGALDYEASTGQASGTQLGKLRRRSTTSVEQRAKPNGILGVSNIAARGDRQMATGALVPRRQTCLNFFGPRLVTQSDSTVSVLMAAYNESRTIESVLRRILSVDIPLHEVIVVDDGSTDGTAEIVERVAAEDPRVRLLRQRTNRGKTAAIARALREATGEILIIQDADLEYDPTDIPQVIAPIVAGQADVVYGSRFLVRRAARVLYFYHFLANRGLTFLSNLFTNRNMTDIQTCYKAFRAGVLKPLQLTSRGFGMEVEITAMICKTKARTYEVPISYYGRTYDEGKKIGPYDGVMALFYIFYFNLIAAWTVRGRAYVREVNRWLDAQRVAAMARQDTQGGSSRTS